MGDKTGKRRKGRELALQLLYGIDVSKKDAGEEVSIVEKESYENVAVKNFALKLVKGALENLKHIDRLIAECSSNWRLDRMAPIDRNIMRIGVCELVWHESPPAVVIDEAIEIAKKYGTEKSGGFVNGVLDCVRKNMHHAETTMGNNMKDEELIEVSRANGEVEAQLIRSILECNGIQCMLKGEALRLTHGFTFDGLGEVGILVKPQDAKKAMEALEENQG